MAKASYTIDDLQVVRPLQSMRAHPSLYLAPSMAPAEQLSAMLQTDADHFGDGATCFRHGDWWVVWGKSDWMHGEVPVEKLFARIIAVPGGRHEHRNGLRYDRAEVYLTAYADDVFTWSAPISGDSDSGDSKSGWLRIAGGESSTPIEIPPIEIPAGALRLVAYTCTFELPPKSP